MKKGIGTLLGVGTKYLQAKEIKGEFYVKVSDFNRCMDGIRIEQEADRKHIEELEEENKNLKEKVETLELWLDNKEKLNEEYRKKIDKLRTDNIYEEGLYD